MSESCQVLSSCLFLPPLISLKSNHVESCRIFGFFWQLFKKNLIHGLQYFSFMKDHEGLKGFFGPFCKKISYTAFNFLTYAGPVTGGDRKTAFFLQKSQKKCVQLFQFPNLLCAISYHYKPERCNVGVTFLAFFGKIAKKMHTALSMFCRVDSPERQSSC
jgi:hypothetical protein